MEINREMRFDTETGGNAGRPRIGSGERPDGQFEQTALPNGSAMK